jgi:isocitrate lyase
MTVHDRRLEGNAHAAGSNGHRDTSPAGQAARLAGEWATNPRWRGTKRTYSAEDVIRLRGSVQEEHTLARLGAERLWTLLHTEDYVHSLGALTGNQAVQQVRAPSECT